MKTQPTEKMEEALYFDQVTWDMIEDDIKLLLDTEKRLPPFGARTKSCQK